MTKNTKIVESVTETNQIQIRNSTSLIGVSFQNLKVQTMSNLRSTKRLWRACNNYAWFLVFWPHHPLCSTHSLFWPVSSFTLAYLDATTATHQATLEKLDSPPIPTNTVHTPYTTSRSIFFRFRPKINHAEEMPQFPRRHHTRLWNFPRITQHQSQKHHTWKMVIETVTGFTSLSSLQCGTIVH